METLISAFTQNIPYQSGMVLLGRQDQLLSIPRNNWTPRQHPAPSAPLEEGQREQRGVTPLPGSQSQVHPSTSAHSWRRPQQSHAGRRHQKNLIYYKKKPTKHISATLRRCLGRRPKGCTVCAMMWFLPGSCLHGWSWWAACCGGLSSGAGVTPGWGVGVPQVQASCLEGGLGQGPAGAGRFWQLRQGGSCS